ncbi:hypothetical protein [Hymenobacter setariae]|nr:hypothetical protein [Hymenobacter setariae]
MMLKNDAAGQTTKVAAGSGSPAKAPPQASLTTGLLKLHGGLG